MTTTEVKERIDESMNKMDTAIKLLEGNKLLAMKAHAASMIHLFFDVAEELFCIIDSTKKFVLVSSSWKKALGYEKHELEGRLFTDFVHPKDHENTGDAFKKFNFGNEELSRYYFNRYVKKDGTYLWLRWPPIHGHAYRNTGFVIGVASVVSDSATIDLLEQSIIKNEE